MAINKRPVTIKDVAAYCGVGKSTVSAALRGESSVKSETREKVLAAAAELGYDPAAQDSARRLRMTAIGDTDGRHNRVIALVFPEDLFSAQHFARMAEGTMEVLNRSGYAIFLISYEDKWDKPMDLHLAFNRGDIDGIVASYSPILKPAMLKTLRGLPGFGDKPIIALMRPASGCHSVLTDTFQGGYLLAKRLLELGHRKLLFVVGGSEDIPALTFLEKRWNSPLKDRWLGMTAAFAERGLDIDKHLVTLSVDALWADPRALPENRVLRPYSQWEGNGVELLWHCLQSNPDITAIAAHNDPCAFRIWCTLLDKGMEIPRDMTLFGFDDSDPVFNVEGSNLLSTVHLPLTEMGRVAGSLIIKLIEEKTGSNPINMALPPGLIERFSSAEPRS